MKRGQWTSIAVRAPSNRAAVMDALFAIGAEGVQELGDDLITHLRDVDAHRVETLLRRADPAAAVEMRPTPDVDWSREWRTKISAHRVGRFIVTPPWLAGQAAPEQIVIEPEMAFGTGDHETTRGVLQLMQRIVRTGDDVADLGAGTAVLAIAAAKLGARRCVAIELDPDAIGNAERNIAANGVAHLVTVIEGDAAALLPLVAPVRVVLANIVSSVLLDLLPVIATSLTSDGQAILSGILVEERAVMEKALASGGWAVGEAIEDGPWWSAEIARA